jgi:hypothetical protein
LLPTIGFLWREESSESACFVLFAILRSLERRLLQFLTHPASPWSPTLNRLRGGSALLALSFARFPICIGPVVLPPFLRSSFRRTSPESIESIPAPHCSVAKAIA